MNKTRRPGRSCTCPIPRSCAARLHSRPAPRCSSSAPSPAARSRRPSGTQSRCRTDRHRWAGGCPCARIPGPSGSPAACTGCDSAAPTSTSCARRSPGRWSTPGFPGSGRTIAEAASGLCGASRPAGTISSSRTVIPITSAAPSVWPLRGTCRFWRQKVSTPYIDQVEAVPRAAGHLVSPGAAAAGNGGAGPRQWPRRHRP